jgi:integrase
MQFDFLAPQEISAEPKTAMCASDIRGDAAAVDVVAARPPARRGATASANRRTRLSPDGLPHEHVGPVRDSKDQKLLLVTPEPRQVDSNPLPDKPVVSAAADHLSVSGPSAVLHSAADRGAGLAEEPASCVGQAKVDKADADGPASSLNATIATPSDGPKTLEDALNQLQDRNCLSPEKLRRLRSELTVAARRVAESSPLGGLPKTPSPADLPCDPVELRPLLQQVLPARFWHDKPGKQPNDTQEEDIVRAKRRWSNIRCSIASVLRLTGWIEVSRSDQSALTPAWSEVASCSEWPTQIAVIRRFARFCMRLGKDPLDVTEEVIEAYRDYLVRRTIDSDITEAINALRRVWKNSRTKLEDRLPALTLRRRPGSYVLAEQDLPSCFLEDLEQYLAKLRNPGPFDGSRFGRKRSPVTVTSLEGMLKRFASLVISSQKDGVDVTSVGDLCKPAAVTIILTDQYERVGKNIAWPPGAVTVATHLRMMIKHTIALSAAEKAESLDLCSNVKPAKKTGMTRRNRDRIAILEDPEILRRLIELPEKCYKIADRMMRASGKRTRPDDPAPEPKGMYRAARIYQLALIMDILIHKPFRRSSLAKLNRETHFRYDKNGRPSYICIPGTETKTGQDEEMTLPGLLAERMYIFITKYRPFVVTHESPFLFPGKYEGHINPQSLSNAVVEFVKDFIGIPFNTQILRHLTATLVFDEDPTNGPIAQRLLDHASLKTTQAMYGVQRTRGAQAEYARILEARQSRKPKQKKPG